MDAACDCGGIAHYGVCQVCGGTVEVGLGGDFGDVAEDHATGSDSDPHTVPERDGSLEA